MGAPPVFGRFSVKDILGSGPRGRVMRVDDHASGSLSVLKVLLEDASDSPVFKRFDDFRAIDNPHVLRHVDIGQDGSGLSYIVYEATSGNTLDGVGVEALPLSEGLDYLRQGLNGLKALHSAGVLHGNLKLSNLLLTRPRARGHGQVILLDPGFNPPMAPDPMGRLAIAPERLDGGEPSPRSDLYAFGVIFYQALTGTSPFVETGGLALAKEKRRGIVEAPSSRRLEVTARLDALLLSLLNPDPALRPASVDEVLRSLDSLEEEPTAPIGSSVDVILPLQGREQALAAMDKAIEALESGKGQVLVFAGGEGLGKSRILQEMRLKLRTAGIPIQSTRGRGPEHAMAPMRRLIGPILSEHGEGLDLTEAAPALQPYLPPSSTPTSEPLGTNDLRGRGTPFPLAQADRLASFFMGDPQISQGLVIDDAHLGAHDLQRLMAQVALRIEETPYLLVLALDPSRLQGDGVLGRVLTTLPATWVELGGLSQSLTSLLLTTALGTDSTLEPLHGDVYEWSAGIPARLDFYLRLLINQNILYRRGGTWRLQSERLKVSRAAIPPPRVSLDYALLYGLDEDARLILRVIAILGPSSVDEIGLALQGVLTQGETVLGVGILVRRGLIKGRGKRPHYDLLYASHRTRLAQEVDGADKVRWHRRLAEQWRQSDSRGLVGTRAEAKHWYQAREDREALRPGLTYLGHLEAGWRFEEALEWVGWLLRLRGIGIRQIFEIRARGVRLALRLGDVAKAREFGVPLGAPSFGAECPEREWESELLRGLICLRSSAYEEARTHLEAASAWLPSDASEAQRVEVQTACALSRMLTGRPELADRLVDDALHLFGGSVHKDVRRQTLSLWALKSNLSWVRGRSEEAESIAQSGLRAIKSTLAKRPDLESALRGELGHLYFMKANASYFRGRYGNARDSALEGACYFRGAGDLAFEARCHHLAGLAQVMLGRYPEAIGRFEVLKGIALRAHSDAERAQALFQLGPLFRISGEFDRGVQALEEAIELAKRLKDRRLHGQLLGSLGEVWHRRGDFALARKGYEEAVNILQFTSKRDLLETLRRLLELAFDEGKLQGFEVRVAEALTLARSQGNRQEEGNLLSLLGVYAARMGRTREALDHFTSGETVLREETSRYALGRLKLRQGRVYLDMGAATESDAALRAAEEIFLLLGAEPDLHQVQDALEQLDQKARGGSQVYKKLQLLLEVNRSLTEERELPRLLDLLVQKAIDLTGAERGFVILYDADGAPTLHHAHHMAEEEIEGQNSRVSQTVLARVREKMAPVMVMNVDRDVGLRVQKSVVALGLRAIMAAPLRRGDGLLGILYLDSSRPLEEFYRRDLSLIEALADAAAIAVENAQLLESLRRKNELMSILAHEFRSPVTATLLSARRMLRLTEGRSDEEREPLEHIARQGERLGRMIDNVLQFSAASGKDVAWAMARVDIEGLVRSAVREMTPIAEEQGVKLVVYMALGRFPVWGNADRLLQVCVNLLANAIKVSPNGEMVTLSVRPMRGAVPRDGDAPTPTFFDQGALPEGWSLSSERHLEVSIEDRGPGLPQEALEQVFSPYVQVGDSQTREKGTGLGLYITREIVAEHGGTIWAENRPTPTEEADLFEDRATDLIRRDEMAQALANGGLEGALITNPGGSISLKSSGAAFRFTLPLMKGLP